MNPQDNPESPSQPTTNISSVANPSVPPAHEQTVPEHIPFYRKYWSFGAIYLLLPPLIGLLILVTGKIYRKQKDGHYLPIKKSEGVALTIIAIILWLGAFSFGLHPHTKTDPLQTWYTQHAGTFNVAMAAVTQDVANFGEDAPALAINDGNKLGADCQKLLTDASALRTVPQIPDTTAQASLIAVASNFESLSQDCLAAVNSHAKYLPQTTLQYLDQATNNRDAMLDQLAKDGFDVGPPQ